MAGWECGGWLVGGVGGEVWEGAREGGEVGEPQCRLRENIGQSERVCDARCTERMVHDKGRLEVEVAEWIRLCCTTAHVMARIEGHAGRELVRQEWRGVQGRKRVRTLTASSLMAPSSGRM